MNDDDETLKKQLVDDENCKVTETVKFLFNPG
jgi:hypothetical protein